MPRLKIIRGVSNQPITSEELAVDLSHPKCKGMKEGDKVTIAGLRLFSDGTLEHDCKQGEETVFTVRAK